MVAKVKVFITELFFDIISGFFMGIAVNMFTAKNNIAPGGVTGISTLINYLTGVPIGTLSLILNVPLLLLAYKFLGKRFTFATLKTVVIVTIMLDYAFFWVEPYTDNPVMAALYGGVFIGAAIGIMLMRGSCTGGSDIASKLIQIRAPHISMGKIFIMLDGLVLALSVLVYGKLEPAMLGMVTIYVSSQIVDSLLYGMDSGVMMFVVSETPKLLGDAIVTELGRSATYLRGTSAYTGSDREVVLCAVRKNQSVKLRRIVHRIDPKAFIMSTEASEILGFGFNPIDK